MSRASPPPSGGFIAGVTRPVKRRLKSLIFASQPLRHWVRGLMPCHLLLSTCPRTGRSHYFVTRESFFSSSSSFSKATYSSPFSFRCAMLRSLPVSTWQWSRPSPLTDTVINDNDAYKWVLFFKKKSFGTTGSDTSSRRHCLCGIKCLLSPLPANQSESGVRDWLMTRRAGGWVGVVGGSPRRYFAHLSTQLR